MKARVLGAVAALLFPAIAFAQGSKPATYITKSQIDEINKLPGIDRQIVNTDVGNTNLAVGIIHRGKTGAPPAGAAGAAGATGATGATGAAGGGGAAAAPCGETGTALAGSVGGGIWHLG